MARRISEREYVDRRLREIAIEEENKRVEDELERRRSRKRITNIPEEDPRITKAKIQEKVQKEYAIYKGKLMDSLLEDCILAIYHDCVPTFVVESLGSYRDRRREIELGFVRDFIKHEGYDSFRVVNRWKNNNNRQTGLLNRYGNIITEVYKGILEEVDKNNPESYGLPSDANTQFYSKLSTSTPDEVIEIVKGRVNDSIDTFLDDNKKMKNAINDIYANAQTKIQTMDDDVMKEGINLKLRRDIQEVKSKYRPTFFGELLTTMTESVLMEEEISPLFINEETNRLNHDTCIGVAGLMYTLLETVNALGIKRIDSDYRKALLEEMRDNIQKAKRAKQKR